MDVVEWPSRSEPGGTPHTLCQRLRLPVRCQSGRRALVVQRNDPSAALGLGGSDGKLAAHLVVGQFQP